MTTKKQESISVSKAQSSKRYTKQIKLAAVSEVETGADKKNVCLKYGMDISTLRALIDPKGKLFFEHSYADEPWDKIIPGNLKELVLKKVCETFSK